MHSIGTWLLEINSADEDTRRRGRTVVILAFSLLVVATLFVPVMLLQPNNPAFGIVLVAVANLLYILIMFLARRGYVTLSALLFVATEATAVLASAAVTDQLSVSPYFLVMALVAASLTLRPRQIWLVLGLLLGGLAGASLLLSHSPLEEYNGYINVFGSALMLVVVGIMSFLGAQSTERALAAAREGYAAAQETAAELSAAKASLEMTVDARTAELQGALAEVRQRADTQDRLLREIELQRYTILELSVPVIPISATKLIMPLVGALDSTRLQQIQEQALQAIDRTSARHLIMDITGVPIVDTQVAYGLLSVVSAARLLGAEVLLVGIRPEVAQAIVGLGLSLDGMRTASDLQSVLGELSVN